MNYILNLLLLLLLASCQKKEPTSFSGTAMTIDYHILIGDPLTDKKEAEKIIQECFAEVDQIYNKWNPSSELSRLNQWPAHTPAPLSEKLYRLLALTDEIYRLTEGRFDPTIEPLQKVWRSALEQGCLPAENSAARYVGWNKIHFTKDLFWKDEDACALDLSGIAKGYAIDLILETLQERLRLKNLFIEWGGEIRAIGAHPTGRPWTIFISRFGDESVQNAIDTLPLQDQAIATSGDYMQKWTVGETTYCHILDPFTLKPLSGQPISSASVLAPNCALADGLATAAMIFPTLEEAQAWAQKIQETHPEIQFWLVENKTLI